MRGVGAVLSTAALFWGFIQAPFVHIHAEDHNHPATSPAHVHHHLAGWAEGPTVDARDEDAIDLEWSVLAPERVDVHLDVGLPECASISPIAFPSIAIQVPRHRGHDPPSFSPKQPRAPPV